MTEKAENQDKQRGIGLRTEVLWMYIVQGTAGIMPLVLIHHAGRVVGPTEWGRLALAEAIGRYLQVVVEYGFQVSGSRDAAIARNSPNELLRILTHLLSAQGVLAAVSVPIGVLLGSQLGLGANGSLLIGSAVLWGVAQAMTLSWFFQAVGQIRRFALIDIVMRALAVTAVYELVSKPSDAWRVLGIQAAGSALTFLISFAMVSKLARFPAPSIRHAWSTIRRGFALFSFRAAGMLYISLNVVILSFYVSKAEVGVFAAAERICRLSLYALTPLNTVFYVRIARLKDSDPDGAYRLAQRGTFLLGAAGLGAGFVLALAGPWIAVTLFGQQFQSSGTLTRWFGAVVALATLNSILGAAWLLPARKDRTLSMASLFAGVANLVLAAILAPRYGTQGMVISLIVCELIIAVVYYRQIRSMGVRFSDYLRQNYRRVRGTAIKESDLSEFVREEEIIG